MERLKLCCRGQRVGEITMEPMGSRIEIRAAMPDPGDGLYRAVLIGERGELPLGVMEPGGGQLTVCRRPYGRDVARLGATLRGDARRSYAFAGARAWRRTEEPAELFESQWLRSRLEGCGCALWRRECGYLYLALPFDMAKPFPLETLFCLARLERIEGRCWVVYAFNGEETPVGREKT